jgi:hypothetical protein
MGFTLSATNSAKCEDKIPMCKIYSSETECLQCMLRTEPTADNKKCLNGTLLNCMIYSANKKCSQCAMGYKVDITSGLCV